MDDLAPELDGLLINKTLKGVKKYMLGDSDFCIMQEIRRIKYLVH